MYVILSVSSIVFMLDKMVNIRMFPNNMSCTKLHVYSIQKEIIVQLLHVFVQDKYIHTYDEVCCYYRG